MATNTFLLGHREARAAANLARLGPWLAYLGFAGCFSWTAIDQIHGLPYVLNGLATYIWVPAGLEQFVFWILTAAEAGVAVMALLPRTRRFALVLGASILLAMALLPLGNLWSLGVAACGAKFSLLIRPPGWKNFAFLASTSAFLFSIAFGRDATESIDRK